MRLPVPVGMCPVLRTAVTSARSGSGSTASSTSQRHGRPWSSSLQHWLQPAWRPIRGLFTDVPDRVNWPGQQSINRCTKRGMAVSTGGDLSDGESWPSARYPLYRYATERLLRDLRRWPRLCFVDCSPTSARLAPLLAPYGLETIALVDLPHCLAEWSRGRKQTPSPVLAYTATPASGPRCGSGQCTGRDGQRPQPRVAWA